MRRRSLWKLPVAAVAAILLPRATSPPPPEVAHPLFIRRPYPYDEMDTIAAFDRDRVVSASTEYGYSGEMSGYAIIQEMAEQAHARGVELSPQDWYKQYLALQPRVVSPGADLFDAHIQAIKDVIDKKLSPQWRYSNGAWAPAEGDA